jgi:hypothetical protein
MRAGEEGLSFGLGASRSMTQRRLFARLELDGAMFFAAASSVALDSVRLCIKWSFRAKEPRPVALSLDAALAWAAALARVGGRFSAPQ